MFGQILLLFKSLSLEVVVLSLWGALSDERPGSVFCKSQSSHLSVCKRNFVIAKINGKNSKINAPLVKWLACSLTERKL
jgi:hypothetical protein